MDTIATLNKHVQQCNKCILHKTRINPVPGAGNTNADIMFIGEGPGKKEDETGVPFVGAAGKFLDELLDTINLSRADVYIANVVKCRPPNNRDPKPEEIEACLPYLKQQIILIQPKIIVTLGRFSMNLFLPHSKITLVHGKPQKLNNLFILPLYHPAVALYNSNMKETLKQDFSILKSFLSKLKGS